MMERSMDDLCRTSAIAASNFSESYTNLALKVKSIQRGCHSYKDLQ